ncbi:MAG: N-acetylneuraminate synthase family protein [Lysobacterales bacterium]
MEIIAELHPQHGGKAGLIREFIREAALNGADVAKFQLYDAEALLGSDRWNYLQLDFEMVKKIKRWCDEDGIEFMCSVFDEERLQWCEEIGVKRHKIASRTVKDPRLCEAIIATGKPIIMSLGMHDGQDLPYADHANISYLHCKSSYPAFTEEMCDFPASFSANGVAGYSDHCLGIGVCLLAIARGATIIEKHMSLNKATQLDTERAHVCSMTPAELAQLRRVGGELCRIHARVGAVAPRKR